MLHTRPTKEHEDEAVWSALTSGRYQREIAVIARDCLDAGVSTCKFDPD
jgi:hypothetical protein